MTPLKFGYWRSMWVVAMSVGLVACGGGGEDRADSTPPGAVTPPPERAGQLQSSAPLGRIAASDIAAALAAEESVSPGVTPRYSVTSYRLEYLTSDADGKEVRASGLVSVPIKADGAVSPVLSYQHATIFRDAEAPSNNAVASEVSVLMASLGFIVLAPDFVGFGASKGTPHPYLLAAPSAAATVDFLTAASAWRQAQGVRDNGQLFMTGYSEGGYVTLAAQRALQQAQSPHLAQLRRVVAGAGPYSVQATLDGLVNAVRDENKVVGALINPGFLRYLGGSVQRELRRVMLRALLPDDADVSYDTRFIDNFLADDVGAIDRLSNVSDWKPTVPVRLFHGPQDRTVPYASSVSTLRAMQQQGAGDLVTLTDCRAQPSDHLDCVGPFFDFMIKELAPVAKDL